MGEAWVWVRAGSRMGKVVVGWGFLRYIWMDVLDSVEVIVYSALYCMQNIRW